MAFITDGFRMTGYALTLQAFWELALSQHSPNSPDLAKAAQFIDNCIDPTVFTPNCLEWGAGGGPFSRAVELYNGVIMGKGAPPWWPLETTFRPFPTVK